ncbi:MAG: PAS domain S-box protein [Smithella sp.]
MFNSDCIPGETQEIVLVLVRYGSEIQRIWLNQLKKVWGKDGASKVALLAQEQEGKKDLLSIIIHQISGNAEDERKCREGVIDRVRSENYSVEDFLIEIECLENSAEEVLKRFSEVSEIQTLNVLNHIRQRLGALVRSTMQQTCGVYEKMVESGARGFCLFRADGTIVATNEAMKRLLETSAATGRTLESFFDTPDRALIRDILSCAEPGKPRIVRSHLHTDQGTAKPVGIEIALVNFHGEEKGGYLCAVDLSSPDRMEKDIFDKLPLGVTKQTLEGGKFTYMNPVALHILGLEKWEGVTLRDIFPDDENYSRVSMHLKKRAMGLGDKYPIEATRPPDRKKIPLILAAVPETDLEGNIIGSVAIFPDPTVGIVKEKIYSYIHITTTQDYREMLDKIVQELLSIIPFDRFIITLYNTEMTHLREFYSYDRIRQIPSNIRWWPIPASLLEMLKDKKTNRVDNLEEFLNQPYRQHLKTQPEFMQLFQEGFKSLFRYPVVQLGKVVAGITLLSKKERTYGEEQVDLFKMLPVGKAVLTALHHEEMKDLEFRLNLIQKIAACLDISDVARTIVEELSAQHQWSHISLFRINEKNQEFELLRQQFLPGTPSLPEPFCLPIGEKCVLNHVYTTGEAVKIDNVKEDPIFRNIYKPALPDTLSEYCMPIEIRGKLRWLMNIEDSRRNAFSKEEMDILLSIVREISNVLDSVWLRHFLQNLLDSTSDLVFVTDRQGKISQTNPETTRQLGYTRDAMMAFELKEIIANPEEAQDAIKAPIYRNRKVELRQKSGGLLPVLLSGSELPEDFESKVFVGKDVSVFERVKELEYLGTMYHEIAVQTQTPLALAFGWIKRLKEETSNKEAVDTLDKALKQLLKVEMTYSRLALYEKKEGVLPYQEVLFRISEVVDHVLSEFPEAERNRITDKRDEKLPYLRGDLFQLTFCFEAILSYLLRYLPQEEKINIEISAEDGWVNARIAGFLPDRREQGPEGFARLEEISKTIMQMALGDEMIKKFIHNHKGEFSIQTGEGFQKVFEIRLPVVQGEA